MRTLKYHVAVTVDGFIAREDHTFDCFPMEGEHVQDYLASFATYDTVLMGRRTYEVGFKYGVTNPYPMLKSFVFSRSMQESPDPAVTLVREDPIPFVRTLKEEEGKDIYLCGGGELASTLFNAGLIDEVLVKLNPLLLGAGIPVSPRLRELVQLELLSTKVYRSNVVLLRYAVKR